MPRGVYVRTPEYRAKLSAAHKGRVRPRGMKRTPEQRARMSAAARNRSPEYRAMLSARAKDNRYALTASVKGECAYCGAPATEHDHMIPRSRGGSDDPENIVLCCRPCNSQKRTRTPAEWITGYLKAG